MTNDKDILEQIHINVHAIRLIPNYKPSNFEFKVARLIAEKFAATCAECKAKHEQYKNQPEVKKAPGVMSRLKDALGDTD